MTLDTTSIRQAHARTTQGEWREGQHGTLLADRARIAILDWPGEFAEVNAAFIALAHNTIIQLCDAADGAAELEAQVARLRDVLEKSRKHFAYIAEPIDLSRSMATRVCEQAISIIDTAIQPQEPSDG